MANVGGMQRVASKLHEFLRDRAEQNASLSYDAVLLRTPWRSIHRKVPFFLVRAAWNIARAARRDSVDVVLFSSMVTASLAVPLQGLLRRHEVKTAAIVHGLDVTTPFPPYQWFVPKVFGALDAVLPVSRATQAACLDRGASSDRLRVIPNGIDTDRFREPKSRAAARQALQDGLEIPTPSTDELLLCSVGRQVKRKGTAWFVDHVMPQLPSDVHYWIAGDGPQGPEIQDAIDRHDLHPRARRLGRISNANLARLYRGSDLFIMPNVPVEGDMEGFGVVLLEAGQCGTPAIASRLEGIRDVLTEGVNGHLVDPKSPDAFVEAIQRYYRAPNALEEAARRAIDHTQKTFGWSAVADTYVSVLRTLQDKGHVDPEPSPRTEAERTSSRSSS